MLLQLGDVDAQKRQPLRPVVVHLAGNAPALLLLGMKQLGGELAETFARLPERLFSGPQGLIRPLACQGVGEDLAHQAEALDQVIRPVAAPAEGSEPDGADDGIHHLQRDHDVGFQPHPEAVLPLRGRFGGQIVGQPRQPEHLSLVNGPGVPGQLLVQDDPGLRRHSRHVVGVSDHQLFLVHQQFSQAAPVNPEELHEPPQGRLDLRIDLTGGKVDEGGRQLRQQGLEAQALLHRRGQRATCFLQDVAQVRGEGRQIPGAGSRADTGQHVPDSILGLILAGGLILGSLQRSGSSVFSTCEFVSVTARTHRNTRTAARRIGTCARK